MDFSETQKHQMELTMFTYHPPQPTISTPYFITASYQRGIVDTSIFFLSLWCNVLAMWLCWALPSQQWLFNGWSLLLCQLFLPHSFLRPKKDSVSWMDFERSLRQPVAKIVLTVVKGRFGAWIDEITLPFFQQRKWTGSNELWSTSPAASCNFWDDTN